MTNREQADRLMSEAGDILEELSRLLSRRAWNLVVRRAQEVVELALKALMIEMGVDYPKAHDVAPLFARMVRARAAGVDEETLAWLEQTSARLARARGPAFYLETDFSEGDAKEAAGDAHRVIGDALVVGHGGDQGGGLVAVAGGTATAEPQTARIIARSSSPIARGRPRR